MKRERSEKRKTESVSKRVIALRMYMKKILKRFSLFYIGLHEFVNFYFVMKTPYTFKGVPFCHAFKICIQNKIKQWYINKNTINNV